MGQHETVFTLEATPIKFGPGAVISPRGVEAEDLGHILNASMTNW